MKFLALLLLAIVCSSAEKRSFKGYAVYRTNPIDVSQIEFLQQLESKYEFWNDIKGLNSPVDIMVDPENRQQFEDLMNSYDIQMEVLIEDVQELISEDHVKRLADSKLTWDIYYELADIHAWIDTLPLLYPGVAEVVSAGASYERKNIKGVKISYGTGRPSVFLEGGIHAREWISPATVTYIMNQLLSSDDTRIRTIAESFDWHIFPVTNPDGYDYTHTTDRVWRKTRRPYPTTLNCTGVDGNRNYDFDWGVHSTSTNSCSNTFGGPSAFSEPETISLVRYIASLSDTLEAYFSFHSYSQVLLIPYGNATDELDNFDDLLIIGNKSIEALTAVHGTRYRVGNTAALMGKTSGTTTDWVKDTYGTPITFTYELRDTGRYGFILPPDQIIPNSEEVLESLLVIFEEAANLGYFPVETRRRILH